MEQTTDNEGYPFQPGEAPTEGQPDDLDPTQGSLDPEPEERPEPEEQPESEAEAASEPKPKRASSKKTGSKKSE